MLYMTEITYQTTAEDIASKSLQVTVPLERLAAAERRAVREYARQARLPGFRKGHAPEPVVRKKFEQEIKRSVLEDALRESWETILKQTELQPTGDPQIRNVQYQEGSPLTFDLLIEVRPKLTVNTLWAVGNCAICPASCQVPDKATIGNRAGSCVEAAPRTASKRPGNSERR